MERSLFEKEEKENYINQLKVDLISRFYLLSADEIIRYKKILNFDSNHLMDNESVIWDTQLIDEVKDKIDWSSISRLINIKIDLPFIKRFEQQIVFPSIQFSKGLEWSEELLDLYADRFDWSKTLILRKPLSTLQNLRKFKDILDWSIVSRGINLSFTDDILEEFADKWDWKRLSYNINLPANSGFILKYIDKLDFESLSRNPTFIYLIYRYPELRWRWDIVISNPGIIFNQKTFNFLYSNYKKHVLSIEDETPISKDRILPVFLRKIFWGSQSDLSFFLNDTYSEMLPWDIISEFNRTPLPEVFILKNKEKLKFKKSNIADCIRDSVSSEFVLQHLDLFDKNMPSFYRLPLTQEIVIKCINEINWHFLARNEKLDWNWEFIEKYLYDFNLFRYAVNKGIYEKLILKSLSHQAILEILETQLKNKF